MQRLVGAGGRTERDPMKCAVWFLSVPVCTSMYQFVLVCTMNRLNLSSFEIQLRHIKSHAKELYSLYLISSDSFWMSQETTCLLECTYWYVPVPWHTCTYDREILVLPCTMLYQYVLVRTSIYRFAQSCPGVQDSRSSWCHDVLGCHCHCILRCIEIMMYSSTSANRVPIIGYYWLLLRRNDAIIANNSD